MILLQEATPAHHMVLTRDHDALRAGPGRGDTEVALQFFLVQLAASGLSEVELTNITTDGDLVCIHALNSTSNTIAIHSVGASAGKRAGKTRSSSTNAERIGQSKAIVICSQFDTSDLILEDQRCNC